ncbi:ferredoxin [Mycolicibacterium sp. XJ1819]
MKVLIDQDRCHGHGRCYAIEPDLFEPVDDHGHSGFLPDGLSANDADLLARVAEVSANCPEQAITIHESESAQR